MANNRTGAFVGGLLLGTAIGTAIGLLVAPRSGRETRRFLRKSAQTLPEVADDVGSNLQQHKDRLLDSAQKSLDETLGRLQEALKSGKREMELHRQQLSQEMQNRQTRLALSDDAPAEELRPASQNSGPHP